MIASSVLMLKAARLTEADDARAITEFDAEIEEVCSQHITHFSGLNAAASLVDV